MTALAEFRKFKMKARQTPGLFLHHLSDRLYSRPTNFIVSDHTSPVRLPFRRRRYFMNAKVGPLVFLFLIEAQAEEHFQGAIDDGAADQGYRHGHRGHDQLRHEGDPARATQRLAAKDARRNATPGAAQTVQRL